MNGPQHFVDTNAYNSYFSYFNPNSYDESRNMQDMYLQRIYCDAKGWSQTGGTANNVQHIDWSVAANTSVWDTGSAGAAVVTGDSSLAANLRIHNAARLKLGAGAQLTCTGSTDIREQDGLWIHSDASGSGSFIDNGTITYTNGGSAKVQRYFEEDKWHGYCIPVVQTVTAPFHELFMKYYSEPVHHYRYVIDPPLDSVLNITGMGFMMWSRSSVTGNFTADVSGQLNTGQKMIALTGTAGATHDGFNLIGNPYPSAVNWESPGWTLPAEVSPTLHTWIPGPVSQEESGTYGTWNRATGEGTLLASPMIQAQQAFFAEVIPEYTGSFQITADNTVRCHDVAPFYKESRIRKDLLQLKVAGEGMHDEAKIWFREDALAEFEYHHDNRKLMGGAGSLQIWCPLAGGDAVAVHTLPWISASMIIPVSLSCGQSGIYELNAANTGSFDDSVRIHLEDTRLNIMKDLRQVSSHIFFQEEGVAEERFRIHFFNPGTPSGDPDDSSLQVYAYDGAIWVVHEGGEDRGELILMDLWGREIHTEEVTGSCWVYRPVVGDGVYVVRVIYGQHVKTDKILLRHLK